MKLSTAESVAPWLAAQRCGIDLDDWQKEMLFKAIVKRQSTAAACGRQVGKSEAVAWAVITELAIGELVHGREPMVVLAAPAQRQSGELLRRITGYLRKLDAEFEEVNKSSLELRGGGRVVAIPGQANTVRSLSGLSLLAVDEAAFFLPEADGSPSEFFASVLPMVSTTNAPVFLASSPPIHSRGSFFSAVYRDTEAHPHWHRMEVSQFDCGRISAEAIAEQRALLTETQFEREIMGRFVETMGAGILSAEEMEALRGSRSATQSLDLPSLASGSTRITPKKNFSPVNL